MTRQFTEHSPSVIDSNSDIISDDKNDFNKNKGGAGICLLRLLLSKKNCCLTFLKRSALSKGAESPPPL